MSDEIRVFYVAENYTHAEHVQKTNLIYVEYEYNCRPKYFSITISPVYSTVRNI